MTRSISTREQWLLAVTGQLRPFFAEVGAELPEALRVSCGWPSSRGLASPSGKNRTIGQCWPTAFSGDGTPEVFISPVLCDAVQVGATLVHELVHVKLDCSGGHGPTFKKHAVALGLEGKMTATVAGAELTSRLVKVCAIVGPYPHATLDRTMVKKEGTRMLKLLCPDCGYTARTTAKWLAVGCPTCVCGSEMEAV